MEQYEIEKERKKTGKKDKRILGWRLKHSFRDLVKIMTESDLKEIKESISK